MGKSAKRGGSERHEGLPKDRPAGLSIFSIPGFHGTFTPSGYTDQTARDGRPLAEMRAPQSTVDKAIADGVPMEIRPSLLTGTRRGKMENRSALDAIISSPERWQELLDGLAWINLNYFGESNPQLITTIDIQTMALIGVYATSFALNRGQNGFGPYGELPNVLSDILKVCLGIYTDGLDMEHAFSGNVEPRSLSANAEERGLLITPDNPSHACPAPPAMIDTIAEALMTRQNGSDPRLPNAGRSELQAIFPAGDFQRIRKYIEYSNEYIGKMEELTDEISDIFQGIEPNNLEQRKPEYERVLATHFASFMVLQSEVNIHLGRNPINAPIVDLSVLAKASGNTWQEIKRRFGPI